MESLHPTLETIADIVDLGGLLIIAIGTLKFLWLFVTLEYDRLAGHECTGRILGARRILGGYILVALEFMIVSDVIMSVVSQSLESLAYLMGIVTIRTAIGYFLARELEGETPRSS